MSKGTRTPGPWTVAGYLTMNSGAHVIRGPEKGPDDPHPCVASVVKRPGYSANARLIAAAPELLAACESALERIDGMNEAQGVIDELRAAINKAKGTP